MQDLNDRLFKLQCDNVRKTRLNVQLTELKKQMEELEKDKNNLYNSLLKENEDVEKLEGGSLKAYFFEVLGKKEARLEIEREEAYKAKIKYDSVLSVYNALKDDIDCCQAQINSIGDSDSEYKELLLEKRRTIMESEDSTYKEKILSIEEEIGYKKAQIKEINEAYNVGCSSLNTLCEVKKSLESAKGWSGLDMFGGGLVSDLAKHSHIDQAQELISELQIKLNRYKSELSDINFNAELNVNIDGFLKFADFFFDCLFTDWAVRDKITNSLNNINSVESKINSIQNKLTKDKEDFEKLIISNIQQINNIIAKA